MGTPAKAGTFKFSVCAYGDYGEEYWEYTLTVKEPAATEPTQPSEPEESVTQTQPEQVTVPEATETKPVETEASTEPVVTTGPSQPEGVGFPWWGYLLIAVTVVSVGTAVTLLIVLLKKKKA